MGLYVNGQKDHSNSILTFSVDNGRNLGDVVNSHPGWEIIFGSKQLHGLAVKLDRKTFPLNQVGGLLYNAEEPHHEFYHKVDLHSEAIVIRQEFLHALIGELIDIHSIRFTPAIPLDSTYLENARQTYLALRSGFLDKNQARTASECLVIDLLEMSSHNKKDVLRKINLSSTKMLLKELLTEIHISLFDEDLNLKELADKLGVTQFHLIRTMKTSIGLTPYTYIRRLRLHHAEALLRKSHLSITRVAFDCGFSDTSSFNKAFRGWKGVSPSVFRKTRT